MAGSGLSGEVRICEEQAYMAKEMRGESAEQAASMRSLCYEIFSTVAKTPDDAAASRHIDELVATAKGDEQLEKQLTPQFVRQELTDDPVK